MLTTIEVYIYAYLLKQTHFYFQTEAHTHCAGPVSTLICRVSKKLLAIVEFLNTTV